MSIPKQYYKKKLVERYCFFFYKISIDLNDVPIIDVDDEEALQVLINYIWDTRTKYFDEMQ